MIFIRENTFKISSAKCRPFCSGFSLVIDKIKFRSGKSDSHYNDVITSTMASQITNLTIVYSTIYSSADQRKHQSSASLASVRGIHRWPINSPQKEPVTLKMFKFDDVIMRWCCLFRTPSICATLPLSFGHWTNIAILCQWVASKRPIYFRPQ